MSSCNCEGEVKILSNHLHDHVKRFEKVDEVNLGIMKELGKVEESMRRIEEEQRNCLMHIIGLQHIVKDFIDTRK